MRRQLSVDKTFEFKVLRIKGKTTYGHVHKLFVKTRS